MSQPASPDDTPTEIIAARFCGPPASGNGGYSCGVLARHLQPAGAAVTVTLRAPPPLDAALAVRHGEHRVSLLHGDETIADATPATLDMPLPDCPSFGAASEAASRFRGFERHVFPGCFVCGPARAPADGLCIFAGPLADDPDTVAAPWVPDAGLADASGRVAEEFLWAALDCPGYFALGQPELSALLGRMTAAVLRRPRPGTRCVVVGWPIAHDGRKHDVGTAVFDADGTLYAMAQARWIALR